MQKPQEISFTKKESEQNLLYLAGTLAINHINASTVDLQSEFDASKSNEELQKIISNFIISNDLKNGINNITDIKGISCTTDTQNQCLIGNIDKIDLSPSRNILVIGAGASFNSFENIPLANHTIELLKEKIEILILPGNEKKDKRLLTLGYLVQFCKVYPKIKQGSMKISDFPYLHKKKVNSFLLKQFDSDKNSRNLLKEIGDKFNAEEVRWSLNRSDYGKDKVDFEAFLNILNKILPVETVRGLIKSIYDIKEGTTLFYSIVAHLFKHRIIDIIINFNFDELLDTAIIEELGDKGFDMVLSDGDCPAISEISDEKRLRQPLYIKPHGTASHKSSLRFTKDHYHELPIDMKVFISDLISSRLENGNEKRINLITAGFNMGSIDLNEILINHLPKDSSIFCLFNHNPGDSTEEDNISTEAYSKIRDLSNIFTSIGNNKPKLYLIAHEYYRDDITFETCKGKEIELKKCYCSFGNLSLILFKQIQSLFNPGYKPRSIDRHLLLNHFFGNRQFWYEAVTEKDFESSKDVSFDVSFYPKAYFRSYKYFKDRFIVELFIEMTVNAGKIDPFVFMEGRAGYYYSEYSKELKKEKPKENVEPFLDLLQLAGLSEKTNSLGIRFLKYNKKKYIRQENIFDEFFDQFYKMAITDGVSPFSNALKNYLKEGNKTLLNSLFKKVFLSDNSKIQSNHRSDGYHVFKDYANSDLINTNLLHDLHFKLGLDGNNKTNDALIVNTICMIADNGFQLAKFLPQILERKNIREFKIYLIIQDHFDGNTSFVFQKKNAIKTLKEKSNLSSEEQKIFEDIVKKDFLNIMVLPVKDHNRHMTIFLADNRKSSFLLQSENVARAIYYYKKGLSQSINPIRLRDESNIKHLLEMFSMYTDRATGYNKQLYQKNLNWITLNHKN